MGQWRFCAAYVTELTKTAFLLYLPFINFCRVFVVFLTLASGLWSIGFVFEAQAQLSSFSSQFFSSGHNVYDTSEDIVYFTQTSNTH